MNLHVLITYFQHQYMISLVSSLAHPPFPFPLDYLEANPRAFIMYL